MGFWWAHFVMISDFQLWGQYVCDFPCLPTACVHVWTGLSAQDGGALASAPTRVPLLLWSITQSLKSVVLEGLLLVQLRPSEPIRTCPAWSQQYDHCKGPGSHCFLDALPKEVLGRQTLPKSYQTTKFLLSLCLQSCALTDIVQKVQQPPQYGQ